MGLLTDAEAAWLACAIDGEGSIGTTVAARRDGTQRVIVARVSVTNTSVAFIERARSLMVKAGGRVFVMQAHQGVNAPVLVVNSYAQMSTMAVLLAVEPFLIIKADRARALIEWIEARQAGKSHRVLGRRGGGTPYGPETDAVLTATGNTR